MKFTIALNRVTFTQYLFIFIKILYLLIFTFTLCSFLHSFYAQKYSEDGPRRICRVAPTKPALAGRKTALENYSEYKFTFLTEFFMH